MLSGTEKKQSKRKNKRKEMETQRQELIQECAATLERPAPPLDQQEGSSSMHATPHVEGKVPREGLTESMAVLPFVIFALPLCSNRKTMQVHKVWCPAKLELESQSRAPKTMTRAKTKAKARATVEEKRRRPSCCDACDCDDGTNCKCPN